MPTRYFDIDPLVEGIGYGIMGLTQRQKELKAILDARTKARKKYQKKIAIAATAAGVGAVGGVLAAPLLGLAGSTAAVAAPAGFVGPTLAGGLAAGAVTTPAGAILGGLGGASLAASAAQQFTEGDIGGGLGTLAQPFARFDDRMRRQSDIDYNRGQDLAADLTRDAARTGENIRQAEELSTIPTYGVSRSKAIERGRHAYGDVVTRAPQRGQDIFTGAGDEFTPMAPVEAYGAFDSAGDMGIGGGGGGGGGAASGGMGPLARGTGDSELPNAPGPSTVPGFKRDWGPGQYRALALLEQQRADTVDSPEWVARHSPEERSLQWQALAKQREDIRVTTMPDQPRQTNIDESGQRVPMEPGVNLLPNGDLWIQDLDGSGGQQIKKDKAKSDMFSDPSTPPETIAAYAKSRIVKVDGDKYIVQPNGTTTPIKDVTPPDPSDDLYTEAAKFLGKDASAQEITNEMVRRQAAKENFKGKFPDKPPPPADEQTMKNLEVGILQADAAFTNWGDPQQWTQEQRSAMRKTAIDVKETLKKLYPDGDLPDEIEIGDRKMKKDELLILLAMAR